MEQAYFPGPDHNHRHCTTSALAEAEERCRSRGARLTALRRRVLECLWENHSPLGAYDILERLNANGGRIAPMAVYRALDFLMAQGLAHRLASLNAFTGCPEPGHRRSGQFLICKECGTVAELRTDDISRAVDAAAADRGFQVSERVVEISGTCPHCQIRDTQS